MDVVPRRRGRRLDARNVLVSLIRLLLCLGGACLATSMRANAQDSLCDQNAFFSQPMTELQAELDRLRQKLAFDVVVSPESAEQDQAEMQDVEDQMVTLPGRSDTAWTVSAAVHRHCIPQKFEFPAGQVGPGIDDNPDTRPGG